MTEKKMYQNIILELSDGRLISATAPAFCHVGDKISIKEIRVAPPKELPKGYSYEQLKDD